VKSRHIALCVLTCIILGGSFTVSRSMLAYPVLAGQTVRYAIAALALAAIVAAGRTRVWPTVREFARLWAVAAIGLVAFNVLLMFTLHHAEPALIGTIVGGSPLVLAIIGPLQERRRPRPRLVAAAGVVVLGAGLVEGGGSADAAGVLGAVGILLAEAAFSLLAAPLLPRLGPVRVSAWSCALAVPMLLVGLAVTGETLRVPSAAEASSIVFLGLVLTVVAFIAWYTGVQGLGVERAGVFVGLVPVASLATVAIVDATPPAPLQTTGVLIVTAALITALRTPSPPPLPPPAPTLPRPTLPLIKEGRADEIRGG
jgi:drug/metabolite transporter (DMT)-like permease